MKNEKPIRYFSMFTGVGGFELGLSGDWSSRLKNSGSQPSLQPSEQNSASKRNNSFACIGFSEIDKYANQLLADKFPKVRNYGDATKINPSELPDFDMLCGGFPCQSFSIAGKRRGFQDTRGTMFFHIARILEVKKPRLVFLENVKGLLNHDKGETFKVIIQTLRELGYDVQWMVLNSKFFGVPQNRERVFIIGSLGRTPRPEILPLGEINENPHEQNGQGNDIAHTIQVGDKARGSYVVGTLEGDGWEKRHEQTRRVHGTDGISPTIPTGGGVMTKIVESAHLLNLGMQGRRFKENNQESFTINTLGEIGIGENKTIIRRLTPTECERLQGFPDGWTICGKRGKTEGYICEKCSGKNIERHGLYCEKNPIFFSDTQRYKMMGNAVTVNVIKAIGEKLK